MQDLHEIIKFQVRDLASTRLWNKLSLTRHNYQGLELGRDEELSGGQKGTNANKNGINGSAYKLMGSGLLGELIRGTVVTRNAQNVVMRLRMRNIYSGTAQASQREAAKK